MTCRTFCSGSGRKTMIVSILSMVAYVCMMTLSSVMIFAVERERQGERTAVENLIWGSNANTDSIKKETLWKLISEYEALKLSLTFWIWFALISGITFLTYIVLLFGAMSRSRTLCHCWYGMIGIITILDLAPLVYVFSTDEVARMTYLVATGICLFFRGIHLIVVHYFIKEVRKFPEVSPPPEPESDSALSQAKF